MKLTEHFSLEELTRSETAQRYKIDNTPTAEQVENLRQLAINVLEPARLAYGAAVSVSSGFRSAVLNRRIKGAKTSQHLRGQAADLQCRELRRLYLIIKEQGNFDQLLFETNSSGAQWIHVSYNGSKNRRQAIDNYKA